MHSGIIKMDIRYFCEKDINELCRWFNSNDEILQWAGPGLKYPLDHEQIVSMLKDTENFPPRRLMFVGVQDFVNVVHAQIELNWEHGVAILGRVVVNPAYRGKGLAIPILQHIINHVFEKSEFERIELGVYSFNNRAINIYQKLGFIKEGVRRSAVKAENERWDDVIFSLLRNEYLKIS